MAGLALLVPLAFGTVAAAAILLLADGWIGALGTQWQVMVGIGMACAVTALPILALFMENMGVLHTPLGQRILRYASLDDIAVWAMLALILVDLGQFLSLFIPVSILTRRIIASADERDRWFLGIIWLAACGLAADWAGLHYIVGAFISGVVLDSRWYRIENIDAFRGHILLAIMPIFFLSTGLRTSWEMGGVSVFAAASLLLVAAVAGKLVGMHFAGRLLGWGRGEAAIIGWLLQTKALIMIIFANILLDKQIITSATFTALLLMAIGSTMLTMPVVAPILKRLCSTSTSSSVDGRAVRPLPCGTRRRASA